MYKIFVGEAEDTKQLGKPRRRSEDNIKMEIRNIGLKGIPLIHDNKRLRCFEHSNKLSGPTKGRRLLA